MKPPGEYPAQTDRKEKTIPEGDQEGQQHLHFQDIYRRVVCRWECAYLLARDEEDIILGWGESVIASPTTPDKVQQLKAEDVEHCADMRKSVMSMTKADHHKADLRTKSLPIGLCAFIKSHIFEPDETVLAEWDIAHTDSEKHLYQAL